MPGTFATTFLRLYHAEGICFDKSSKPSSVLKESLAGHILAHLEILESFFYTLLEGFCETHSLTTCLFASVLLQGRGTYLAQHVTRAILVSAETSYRAVIMPPLIFYYTSQPRIDHSLPLLLRNITDSVKLCLKNEADQSPGCSP